MGHSKTLSDLPTLGKAETCRDISLVWKKSVTTEKRAIYGFFTGVACQTAKSLLLVLAGNVSQIILASQK
jgi:hypothetical protein